MKAFLLAAGLGTRLRPLTDTMPKCLVPIDGEPMLYHWLQLLKIHDISDVLINVHYLPHAVRQYVADFESSNPTPQIMLFHEKTLLGNAGTIKANMRWIEDEEAFLIAYADNLTNVDLTGLIQFHQTRDAILTMGLFRSDCPERCGIAALGNDGLILDFTEKPEKPRSNMANAGIYVASPGLLDYIPEGFADLGHDVLPRLVGKMYGDELDGYLRDIGTMESYIKAQNEWKKIRMPW